MAWGVPTRSIGMALLRAQPHRDVSALAGAARIGSFGLFFRTPSDSSSLHRGQDPPKITRCALRTGSVVSRCAVRTGSVVSRCALRTGRGSFSVTESASSLAAPTALSGRLDG
eukprot:1185506-Prorocentrum_minimum.AAC.2